MRTPFLNKEPLIITQGWMENKKTYPSTRGHSGLDFRAPTGRKLCVCAPDVMLHFPDYKNWLGKWNAYGAAIALDWGQADGFIRFLYGHCQNRRKELKGKHAPEGKLVGETDNTGFSSAPHLHFEMRRFYGNRMKGKYYDLKIGANYDLINPETEFFKKYKIKYT